MEDDPIRLEPIAIEIPDAVVPPKDAARTWSTIGEVILCSGFPTQFLIGGLLQAFGFRAQEPSGALSARFIFALSLIDAVLLIALIAFFLRRRGERLLTIVVGNSSLFREAAVGVFSLPMVVTIVVAVSLAIRLLVPQLHNIPVNPLEALISTPASMLAFLVVVIVAGGLREEIQRAFLLHRFRQDLGGIYRGLVITSLAFGLGHSLQGQDAVFITAALGATWGFMYISRGSAVAGIVSHSLFNSGEILRAFLMR